jgi:hypothetical protein
VTTLQTLAAEYRHTMPEEIVHSWAQDVVAAIREMDAPVSGNWIEWKGGECPVGGTICVDVKFRNGTEPVGYAALGWAWFHDGGEDDIIAYRVVSQ